MKSRYSVGLVVIGAGCVALLNSVTGAQSESFKTVARPPEIPTAKTRSPSRPLDEDLGRASGLAWQPPYKKRPGRLWVAFEEEETLASWIPGGWKKTKFSIDTEGQRTFPALLAFDNIKGSTGQLADTKKYLWAIDGKRSWIFPGIKTKTSGGGQTDPHTFAPTKRVQIGHIKHQSKITGFALDPKRNPKTERVIFVTCRGGGLCSTVEVRRPRKNDEPDEILAQVYPGCEPMSIAIDPSGERLWILADNGPDRRAVLLERRIDGSTPRQRILSASGLTRSISALDVEGRPIAIAATKDSVWVLSNADVRTNGTPSVASFVTEVTP